MERSSGEYRNEMPQPSGNEKGKSQLDDRLFEALDITGAWIDLASPKGPLDRAVAPIIQGIFHYRVPSLRELANQKLPLLRRYRDSLESAPCDHGTRKLLEPYIAFWEAVRENPHVLRRELRRLDLSHGMSASRAPDLYMDACQAAMALRHHRELAARHGLWRVLWAGGGGAAAGAAGLSE